MYIYIILGSIKVLVIIWLFLKFHLKKSKREMTDTFKSISYDILEKNNKAFMDLAKANFEKYHLGFESKVDSRQKELEKILAPVKESIDKIDSFTKDVEKQRQSSYLKLNEKIKHLIDSENSLRLETAKLSKALKSPNIRGTWGQIHLKRVVELSGLLNRCDFLEQHTVTRDDKMYRPDLIVRLPKNKTIIIDAKTPIDNYLEAQDTEGAKKDIKIRSHALNLKKHINDLSSKEYFSKFESNPEYVILFLPAEAILSSAISVDPTLLEIAASKNIIIATPTTLIAILKTIAHVWNEFEISKNAKEISSLAKELHDRLFIMNNHFVKLGKNLSQSVDAYNQTVSSFNLRVLPSAKKLKEKGIASKDHTSYEIDKTCNIDMIEKKLDERI
jgi:DNA recombination protein RmuC